MVLVTENELTETWYQQVRLLASSYSKYGNDSQGQEQSMGELGKSSKGSIMCCFREASKLDS